ncbi:hypothetical protein HDK64DRAFT_304064, partial [Phyllosticta capitalensis]
MRSSKAILAPIVEVTEDLSCGALPSFFCLELGEAHDRAFAQSYFPGVGPAMRSAQTVSAEFTAMWERAGV